jgi:iron-sulfur cluster repair protein YtfE (RIC family)
MFSPSRELSMIECTLDSAVVDWVIEHPETMKTLERLGINCWCGGQSLEGACRHAGLDPQSVLMRLQRLIEAERAPQYGPLEPHD